VAASATFVLRFAVVLDAAASNRYGAGSA